MQHRGAQKHFLTLGPRYITGFVWYHWLYWDDAFQFVAGLLLLGQNIAYTHYIPANYKLSAIEAGTEPKPSDAQYSALVASIFTAELVLPLLFWTCLFCAKFSFLWLYRQILRGSGAGMKIWWAANIAVLATYGIILIGLFAECGPARNLTNPESCTSPSSVALDYKFLPMQFSFNVFSDLLVMALPLPLLWRLQMPTRQKLAVTAVFSLAWVTIAMEFLRLIETENALPEVTWLYTSLETEVAVIVASLPAFSFLVSDSDGSRERRSRLRRALSLHSGNSKTHLRLASRAEESNHTASSRTTEESFEGRYTSSIPLPPLAPSKEYVVV
ncbi:MAG: hypothetical protein ASARMPRED_002024 [Alectoria sarmentosa]|nr:MAG: hypothetical protein ASARMPRED_002024 [Alectoria sarmentosa]